MGQYEKGEEVIFVSNHDELRIRICMHHGLHLYKKFGDPLSSS
jgi:hypothetical protein